MRGVLHDNIYTKNESDQQQLQMGGGSWSVNLDDLPEEAILIEYVTPTTSWVIHRHDAFTHGFIRELNGESKLIVPLKWWQEGIAIND